MSSAEEKKWFIYVGDHHEGPFSLNDLKGKMAGGIISNTSYTWAEGMADWQLMTEVQALAPLFNGKSGVTPEQASALAMEVPALDTHAAIEAIAPPVADNMAQPMSVSLAESVAEPSSPRSSFTANSERSGLSGKERTGSALKVSGSNVVASVALESNPLILRTGTDDPRLKGPSHSSGKKHKKLSVVGQMNRIAKKIVILLAIAAVGYGFSQGWFDPVMKSPIVKRVTTKIWDATLPQLLKVTEKVPFLANWISPIPALPDVSAEDYEELRQAASARPDSQGAKFSVGMSKETAPAPVFYVAANLTDGARLRLVLSGVAETLVGTTYFNQTIPVSITKKFSKTDPFKSVDGKFPRGQYLVTLVEDAGNPQALKDEVAKLAPLTKPTDRSGAVRALAAKSYFLGGARDFRYNQELKTFHDELIKKAGEELLSAKAFADLFDKQLTDSNNHFKPLHKNKKVAPAKKKMWSDFHSKWTRMFSQADQGLTKQTPEQIKAERFYSGLYLMLSQVAQSVDKVHKFQDTFITGTGDKKAIEIQIGEAQSGASAAVTALKNRLEAIDKAAGPAGSLPLREDQIQ